MTAPAHPEPIRFIEDIEAFERVTLESRLLSWNAKDWIRRGLDKAPDKVALRYIDAGTPDGKQTVVTYAELKRWTITTANLFHELDAYAGELPIAYVQLLADAKATAEEIQAFAAANSPERAAAPKEILILPKMPLTDVGKPNKVQLRADAASRAFTAALADVAAWAGPIAVHMASDAKSGQRAVISIAAETGAGHRKPIEDAIAERMKPYPTAYSIDWLEN